MATRHSAGLMAAFFIALCALSSAVGQTPFRAVEGPTPRTASGKVDLSGVWQKPYVPDMTKDGEGQKGFAELPFTAWGDAEWKAYDPAQGDYTGACLPFGLTRSLNTPEPMSVCRVASGEVFRALRRRSNLR